MMVALLEQQLVAIGADIVVVVVVGGIVVELGLVGLRTWSNQRDQPEQRGWEREAVETMF
jgi:hypothetical protein